MNEFFFFDKVLKFKIHYNYKGRRISFYNIDPSLIIMFPIKLCLIKSNEHIRQMNANHLSYSCVIKTPNIAQFQSRADLCSPTLKLTKMEIIEPAFLA